MENQDLREIQNKYIESEYKKNPDQFKNPPLTEDADFLRQFGISIPGKESFARGMIKLFPQDFIVEEIGLDGSVYSISKENLVSEGMEIPDNPILEATLVKCSMSTLDAINEIARLAPCDKTQISYAGIKDKEAITAQRISFGRMLAEKIIKIKSPHFFLKDLRACTAKVQKGLLNGNRFTIYLRTEPAFFDTEHSAAFVANLQHIRANGFYNFYYIQRFGMPRLINFHVGLDIIRGHYEEAIKKILLAPSQYENAFMAGIRKSLVDTHGDFKKMKEILSPVSLFFHDESIIVNYLAGHPGNWAGALQQILNTVSLLVYSVPSLFFNEYMSTKIDAGEPLPEELPLLLSDDENDVALYTPFLRELGLHPFSTQYLRLFSIIRLQKRMVKTVDRADIHNVAVTDHGVVISFSLGKGEYATTFLSHLVNLVSGNPIPETNQDPIDSKKALDDGDLSDVLSYFKVVIDKKYKNSTE